MVIIIEIISFQLIGRNYTIKLVARTNTVGYLKRNMYPLLYHIYRFQVNTCFFQSNIHGSRSRTCNQKFISNFYFGSFDQEFSYPDIREIFDTTSGIYLTFGSLRTIVLAPFTQTLSQIITVPESTVEYSLETSIPVNFLLF